MTVEQRNEKNRKRREVSQRNKGLAIQTEASREDINMKTFETVNFETSGCSAIDFTNFATQVPNNNTSPTDNIIERERQRHRERRAKMSVDQRNELNRKRREARQQNKGQHMMSTVSGDVDEKVNVNQDDDSDWLHRNDTFKADDVFTTRDLLAPGGVHETVCNTPNHNLERAAYFRERYKNLTPTEMGSKIEYIRKRRALLADTLSQESIAMESPTYTPEVVHPTTDAIEPDGFVVTPCDWVIPEIASNPFLPAPTQTEDADSPHMSTGPLRRKHVPRGERQAILARRNRCSNIPEETHMLKTVPNCSYCTTKKFEYETPGFCCRGGKVELAPLETPPQLKRLRDSADSDARHFRDNIRFFNGHFSFTSLYCCLDSMTTNVRDSGIYTFRAQGMMYHNIKSFGREGGAEHKHLELYFYDDDPTLEHRYCELGWHANIPKVGVSMDEVDAYRATHRASNANDEDAESPSHLCVSIRPGVFNPILHGKRLFQQFAVDTYIKIESSRLDYIRKIRSVKGRPVPGLGGYMLDGDIRAEKRKYKLTCPEQYDLLISAEIPSNKYPELRKMVIKHMMHGPCGSLNPNCPCTKGRKSCKNHYPRPFSDTTCKGRIRTLFTDVVTMIVKKRSEEMRARNDDVDEIKQYRDARWVTPPEALWRIYGFELSQISPPVMQLQLHLPNMHMVAFHERQMVERVVNRPGVDRSMLTAYFEANRLTRRLVASYIVTSLSGTLGRVMPSALRRLFATILVYCEPSDVAVLWQKHKDSMSEDYQHRSQNKTNVEMVLIDIRNMLQSMGKDIKTFPLPPIIDAYDNAIGTAREVYEEESIQPTVGDVALKDSLNEEQRAAYDKIMSAVDTDQGGLFFVDGPGRTAHSRFKIPLTIDDGAVCSFTKQSGTAELLRKASLIIWDEASMTKRQAVEALDNSMRDIMGRPHYHLVTGLAVVRKGSRAQVVASSTMSYLWESMSHLKLVSNMRAKNDPWFAEFLLRVGGGTEETNSDGDIRLPDDVCVPYSGSDNDLDNLIDFAFPNLNENMSDSTYITSRAILSTRNDWVDMINVKMIDRFQGEHMLKIGCPVILLRNIDPANGLCNGTRLVVRGFQRNSIDAEIVLGKRIFLPRISLCPSDEEMFPFQFKRKQFLVRLSFAMTVNKAQGQTIPNVGVYLPEPVFSHGQLYVALSRATARSNIKILVIPAVDGKKKSRKGVKKNPTVDCGTYTKNIVYKEVLTN
ncbi:ATP-dependent DNA helicase PIF1 [Zea mays]|uniref:ATP-dependent DNA helicase n=1 Tax=Zea mays TaxID=4577 RepID=A0A3L6FSR3_MAIZE|nr:ATP-dependent DNA helicase PIF1 [Zea mays]